MKGRIRELEIGDMIEDAVYGIRDIRSVSGRRYCTLYDKTGSADALLPRGSDAAGLGETVRVSGLVLKGKDMSIEISVSEIAHASRYDPAEIFDGLSDDAKRHCLKVIAGAKAVVGKEDRQGSQILSGYLTREELEYLSVTPATLCRHGRYNGGALMSIAALAVLCRDIAIEHNRMDAGVYRVEPLCVPIMLTASLISCIGLRDYMEAPERARTVKGIERGYMSLCQTRLEELIRAGRLEVSEAYVSRLLNLLSCSVVKRTGLKATSREGTVMRHAYRLLAELDMIDSSITQDGAAEGCRPDRPYQFSSAGRYIVEMPEIMEREDW